MLYRATEPRRFGSVTWLGLNIHGRARSSVRSNPPMASGRRRASETVQRPITEPRERSRRRDGISRARRGGRGGVRSHHRDEALFASVTCRSRCFGRARLVVGPFESPPWRALVASNASSNGSSRRTAPSVVGPMEPPTRARDIPSRARARARAVPWGAVALFRTRASARDRRQSGRIAAVTETLVTRARHRSGSSRNGAGFVAVARWSTPRATATARAAP